MARHPSVIASPEGMTMVAFAIRGALYNATARRFDRLGTPLPLPQRSTKEKYAP